MLPSLAESPRESREFSLRDFSKLTERISSSSLNPPSLSQPLRGLRALARRPDLQRQALDSRARRAAGLHRKGGRARQGRGLQDPARLRGGSVLVLRLKKSFFFFVLASFSLFFVKEKIVFLLFLRERKEVSTAKTRFLSLSPYFILYAF